MLEQRDRDPARRPQSLAGLAGGEGLLEPGQLPHRERGRGGQQHDLVGQPQQPALRRGGGELAGAEAESGEVLGLRGAEGRLGEPSFELCDPGLGGAETCDGGRVLHPAGLEREAGGGHDRVEQLRDGQRQRVGGGLAGQTGGERIGLHGLGDEGGQHLPPVGERPSVDELLAAALHPVGQLLGDGEAVAAQHLLAHGAAACDLPGEVPARGHRLEHGLAPAAVAAPRQGGRVDVEDAHPGAHGVAAAAAQHERIADGQRQRALEGEPGMVLAEGAHPRGDLGGAEVGDQLARGAREVLAGGAAHVDLHAEVPRPGADQRVAATDLLGVDTAEVHGGAADGAELGELSTAGLQTADLHLGPLVSGLCAAVRADQLQPVLAVQGAGGEGPGDHGAGAGDGESTVHPQPHPLPGVGPACGGDELVELLAQRVHPLPGHGGDREGGRGGESGAGELRAGLGADLRDPVGGEVGAGDHEQALVDAEGGDGVAMVA